MIGVPERMWLVSLKLPSAALVQAGMAMRDGMGVRVRDNDATGGITLR